MFSALDELSKEFQFPNGDISAYLEREISSNNMELKPDNDDVLVDQFLSKLSNPKLSKISTTTSTLQEDFDELIERNMESALKESGITMNEHNFATMENFDSALENLNNRLSAYGFPSPLVISKHKDHVKVINCIYQILHQKQKDVQYREEINDKLSRLKCDNNNLSINLQKFKKAYDNAMYEVEHLKIKLKNDQVAFKKTKDKLQYERDQLHIKVKDLLQKQVQYKHLLQRTERELQQLKERMQRLVNEKGTLKAKMDIVNVLPRKDGTRGNWKHGSERNEDALYQHIVGAFSDEKKEIVQENLNLRQMLRDLNSEINQLRNVVYAKTGKERMKTEDLLDGQFDLPYELMNEAVSESIREKIREVMREVQSMGTDKSDLMEWVNSLNEIIKSGVITDKEKFKNAVELISKIQQKLSDYQKVITEQDKLLQFCLVQQERSALSPEPKPMSSYILDNSGIDETDDKKLEKEKLELEKAIQRDQQKLAEEKSIDLKELSSSPQSSDGKPLLPDREIHLKVYVEPSSTPSTPPKDENPI